jgi:hypothetical protein
VDNNPAGTDLSSATAAKRVTRGTAVNALQQSLRRVEYVNTDPYVLAKVTRAFPKSVFHSDLVRAEVTIDGTAEHDPAGIGARTQRPADAPWKAATAPIAHGFRYMLRIGKGPA